MDRLLEEDATDATLSFSKVLGQGSKQEEFIATGQVLSARKITVALFAVGKVKVRHNCNSCGQKGHLVPFCKNRQFITSI